MASENLQRKTLSDWLFEVVSIQNGDYDCEGRLPFSGSVVPITCMSCVRQMHNSAQAHSSAYSLFRVTVVSLSAQCILPLYMKRSDMPQSRHWCRYIMMYMHCANFRVFTNYNVLWCMDILTDRLMIDWSYYFTTGNTASAMIAALYASPDLTSTTW